MVLPSLCHNGTGTMLSEAWSFSPSQHHPGSCALLIHTIKLLPSQADLILSCKCMFPAESLIHNMIQCIHSFKNKLVYLHFMGLLEEAAQTGECVSL